MINHNDQPYEQVVGDPKITIDPENPAQGNSRVFDKLSEETSATLNEAQQYQLKNVRAQLQWDLDRIKSSLLRRKMREAFHDAHRSHWNPKSMTCLKKLLLVLNDVTSILRNEKRAELKKILVRAEILADDLDHAIQVELPDSIVEQFEGNHDLIHELLAARGKAKELHQIESEFLRGDRVANPSKDRCYDLIYVILEDMLKRNLAGMKREDAVPMLDQIISALCHPDDREGKRQRDLNEAQARLEKIVESIK